jgi:hypothetical protein
MWIHYAHNVDCPSDVYNFLLANEIGSGLAKLYEELAAVYEQNLFFDKADETFRLGIHRSAHPIERLKKRYDLFRERVMTSEGKLADAQADQRKAYKEALASAMVKAQRSMLGTKVGATSLSANSVRGLGGQAGLKQGSSPAFASNAARPAVHKDVDGDDVFARSTEKKGGWDDVGTNASRKQEKGPEARGWKGEVLPQRDGSATPKKPAIAVYRDSDEEAEDEGRTPGRSARAGDVFAQARELSETDKLRRNPFSNYSESDLKPAERAMTTTTTGTGTVTTAEKTKPSKVKKASSSASSSRKDAKSAAATKQERYAISMKLMYPGLDIEQAVRKVSKKQKSGERCIEEVIASRLGYDDGTTDPFAFLDERVGQWLPEIQAPSKARSVKRDPTVTAFTKAAQAEVLEMFNGGMMDSDEEDESDDEQSESDEEDDPPVVVVKPAVFADENDAVQPSPTPARPEQVSTAADESNFPAEAVVPATPIRKVFGGDRKPLMMKMDEVFGAAALPADPPLMPQRIIGDVVNKDEEDSVQEDESTDNQPDERESDGIDYMNMPMRELAPLSPITEATEYTRFSRTPATTVARDPWTPGPIADQDSFQDEADESTIAATKGDGAARTSLPPLYDEERDDEQPDELLSASPSLVHHAKDVDQGVSSEGAELEIVPETRGEIACPSIFEQAADLQEDTVASTPAEVRNISPDAAPKWDPQNVENPFCPFENEVISSILSSLPLPLESSSDFVDMANVQSGQLSLLQAKASIHAGKQRRSSSHTPSAALKEEAHWNVQIGAHTLVVRQKLGEGGYGAVFLVEDSAGLCGKQHLVGGIQGDASFADVGQDADDPLEVDDDLQPKLMAVKVESPPNRWEFYILGQLRARLSDESRLSSIICARKFFCMQDESFLLLEYAEKGTLLEIVNNAVKAGVASSGAMSVSTGGTTAACVGVDEVLAMFFVVEVIKVIEGLHAVDIVHGDLKIDNCLLRLHDTKDTWSNIYDRQGNNGWSAKGITLIDFGRAIDLRMYNQHQRFLANWTPEQHDMPQIHDAQSWRKEIDYYGIASIAYCLLFGKYIEPVKQIDSASFTIERALRRYWQVDIWTSLFNLCLNAGAMGEREMAEQLAGVREQMESWLEENCFRAGRNLRGSLKRLELWSLKRNS